MGYPKENGLANMHILLFFPAQPPIYVIDHMLNNIAHYLLFQLHWVTQYLLAVPDGFALV